MFGGSECRKKTFLTSKNISNEGSTALHVVPHRQAGGISTFSIWPYCSKYTYEAYLKKLDSKSESLNSESLHRQDCTASIRVPLTTNRGRTIYPFNKLIFDSCSRKNSSQNLYGQKNVASPLYSKNLDYKNYIRLPKNLTDSSNPTIYII